jgi:hypothetical protein
MGFNLFGGSKPKSKKNKKVVIKDNMSLSQLKSAQKKLEQDAERMQLAGKLKNAVEKVYGK